MGVPFGDDIRVLLKKQLPYGLERSGMINLHPCVWTLGVLGFRVSGFRAPGPLNPETASVFEVW